MKVNRWQDGRSVATRYTRASTTTNLEQISLARGSVNLNCSPLIAINGKCPKDYAKNNNENYNKSAEMIMLTNRWWRTNVRDGNRLTSHPAFGAGPRSQSVGRQRGLSLRRTTRATEQTSCGAVRRPELYCARPVFCDIVDSIGSFTLVSITRGGTRTIVHANHNKWYIASYQRALLLLLWRSR